MSEHKNPLEDAVTQAVDAFVYAPIGFWLDGPAGLPKMIKNGKNQVTNARMMGQFAVQAGQAELEKRTADLDGPLADVLRGVGLIAPKKVPASAPAPAPAPAAPAPPTKKPAKKSPAKKAPAKKAPAKKSSTRKTSGSTVTVPLVGSLPIPEYDSLSASQVVGRLRGLANEELEAVRAYEAAKRARKTILNKVSQLQK